MRVASIDIGSNSIILLIAEQNASGQWHRVEEYTEITRLAEGLDAHHVLQETPVSRSLDVLRRFVLRARTCQCDSILLTGTAPFRRAHNGLDVARAFERVLAIPLHVVTGEEEGRLTLMATRAAFPQMSAMRVLDIGGASTELLCCGHDEPQEQSIDLGVVRLVERFVHHDPPTSEELRVMRVAIRETLHASLVPIGHGLPLIGVGGTVTSLAALALGLTQWDPDTVQGFELSIEEMKRIGETIWPMSLAERSMLPGLDPKRADVVGVGVWYVYEICLYLGLSSIFVSDRGIRWGRIHAIQENGHE